jgi:Ni/Fe-hydrogenase subunit HybB-like protein
MVYVESDLARRAYGHEHEHWMMKALTRVGGRIMIVYLALKVIDITMKDEWGLLFLNTLQSNMFLLEMMVGIIIPLIIVFSPLADKKYGLLVYAWMVVIGVVMNRLNCVFTSMYVSGDYFPSVFEFAVSIGLVAAGCLIYSFLVENFHILGNHFARQVDIDESDVHNLI